MALIQKAFSDIITFSRSSNATRIGPTGLVEYAPHNLILQSQTLENASWTSGNGSVTANSIAAPDGSVTADKFSEDSATSEHLIYQAASFTANNVNTFSIYVKAAERSVVRISAGSTARWDARAFFDVLSGTVTSVANGSASIQNVGNGWYRCVLTGSVLTTGSTNVEINLVSSGTTINYAGTAGYGVYLWGAQLSVGPYALDYTPTTSAAVYGPRFDYDPVTLAARGLLVEEQRTNLILYSEDITEASVWSTASGTVSANTSVAPDGQTTADTFNATSAGGYLYQNVTVSASTTYTVSIFIKAGTKSTARLHYTTGGFGTEVLVDVNLTAGTISAAQTVGGATAAAATIQAFANGWYRVTVTGNIGANTSAYFVVGNDSGTGTVLVWGAQLEAGSFATSYIPTLASTVTRSADVASVNTLSPWYNSSESTLFAEFDLIGSTVLGAGVVQLTASGSNGLLMYNNADSLNISAYVDASSVSLGANTINVPAKVAIAYNGTSNGAVKNGGAVSSVGTTTASAATKLSLGDLFIGSRQMNGHLRRVAYFPRRLQNAELQALTA